MDRSKVIVHNQTSMNDVSVLKMVIIPLLEAGEDKRSGTVLMSNGFRAVISHNPNSRTIAVNMNTEGINITRLRGE